MAEPTIDDALVEAGARAIADNETVPPQPYRYDHVKSWTVGEPDEWQHPETRAACIRDVEKWHRLARAVIAAVRPMIEAELLNAIADPSDGMLATLVPEPVHLYPARGEEYIKLVQSAVAIDRLAMRQTCMNIAAAIRQGPIDEGEK